MKKKTTQKTTKKVAKKPPLEDMTIENKVDYTLVIVEEMRDNFKAFGQELVSLHKKTDAISEELGAMKVTISEINFRLDGIEYRLNVLERNTDIIKSEIRVIKSDIVEIKKTLTAKADLKYVSLFETRVARLEKKLA